MGLTTAATILVLGAVGITVGEGMFTVAAMTTVLIIRRAGRIAKNRKRLDSPQPVIQLPAQDADISDSLSRLNACLKVRACGSTTLVFSTLQMVAMNFGLASSLR